MSVKYNQMGFNVRDFGAKGDGVTDDSAAFQAAIDITVGSGYARGRQIFVPKGEYKLNSTVYLRRQVTLTGETGGGWFASTVILPAKNITPFQVDFASLVSAPEQRGGASIIENMRIEFPSGQVGVWVPTQAYSLGAMVVSTLGANRSEYYTMECTTAGTSGATEPNWDAVVGQILDGDPRTLAEGSTVVDGTVTWTLRVIAGVRVHVGCKLRNLDIQNSTGNGILVAASVDWNPYANANSFSISDCWVEGSSLNGLFLQGSDANAGNVTALSAISNARWGIWDASFLGNTFTACHAATNGQNRAIATISRTGHTVTITTSIPHELVAGDSFILYLSGDGVNFPTGIKTVATAPNVNTITYSEVGAATSDTGSGYLLVTNGGAYRSTGINARNVFLGCYSEQDQLPSEFISPALVISGLQASGYREDSGPFTTTSLRVVDGAMHSTGTQFLNPNLNANGKRSVVELGRNDYVIHFTSQSEGTPNLITSLTRSSGLVTVVTTLAHGLNSGSSTYVTAINDPDFAGGRKTVLEVLSSTSFTYLEAGADATGIAGHYLLPATPGTGFTLADNGPTNYEGWWVWRHANSDARKFMLWSGNLAAVGPGHIWFPKGVYMGDAGESRIRLEMGSSEPSFGTWLTPTYLNGSLRINSGMHEQTGFNNGIFGWQLLNAGTGFMQTLRWPHLGSANQIDITNGVGSPYSILWDKHAGVCFTNTGATALVYANLPTSTFSDDSRFMEVSFDVVDTDGMRVTATGGLKIRWGADLGLANGYLQSTTQGSWLKLKMIGSYSAPEWMVTEATGIWTDGTNTYFGVGAGGASGGVVDRTTDLTLTNADAGKSYTNFGASAAVNLTAPASPSVGFTVKMRVMAAQTFTFTLPSGHQLYVDDAISTTTSGTIYATAIGCSVTLQHVGNNKWFAEALQGSWTTT